MRDMEVIWAAATVAAKHTAGVGVVDHHDGTVSLGDLGELVDGADVAIHREDAVGDEQFVAGLLLDLLQQLLCVGDVFVAEDLDLRAGEPCAVDDAGVVELVGEDEVVFAKDGADSAGVGCEARLKDDAGLDAFEGCDLFFELDVDAHGAGDSADGAGAYAILFRCCNRSLAQLRMIAEAEVVIGGEADDALAIVGADRVLFVVEHTQLEEGSALTKVVELSGKMSELRAGGRNGGHTTIVNLLQNQTVSHAESAS